MDTLPAKHSRALAALPALALILCVALLSACSAGINTGPSAAAPAGSTQAQSAGELHIAAAASTRVLNEELAALTDYQLEFVNAGSGTLVQQLIELAPYDLLITADQASMDNALSAGVVFSPTVLATNSLVMVVPADNPAGIESVADLEGTQFLWCDPTVPCGRASAQLADTIGVSAQPVSFEHAVSDVLGKVISGQADAGWVYRTDAQAAGDLVKLIEIPGAQNVLTSTWAAPTTSGNRAGAQSIIDTLRSPEGKRLLASHGFVPAD